MGLSWNTVAFRGDVLIFEWVMQWVEAGKSVCLGNQFQNTALWPLCFEKQWQSKREPQKLLTET